MAFIKGRYLLYIFLMVTYVMLSNPGADAHRSLWIACLTSAAAIRVQKLVKSSLLGILLVSGAILILCVIKKRYFLNLLALGMNSDLSLMGRISFWCVAFPRIVHHIMLGSAEDISFCQ
jgi:hypothetical protein